MKETYLFIFIVFVCLLFLFACGNVDQRHVTKIYSVDTLENTSDSNAFARSVIAEMLDLKTFPPEKIIFNNEPADRDGKKTSGLEAVLFYEESVYGKILELYMNADFPKGNYTKKDFEFNWLGNDLQAELNMSKPNYGGNPDIFLRKDNNAKLWFLDKKVLVKMDE